MAGCEEFRFEHALVPFPLWRGIPYNAASYAHFSGTASDQKRADGDVEKHVSVGRNVSDSACVNLALFFLKFSYDLHGAYLRRARNRTGWEKRAEKSINRSIFIHAACHSGSHLAERGVFSHLKKPGSPNIHAHPAQVISKEVSYHHILSPVLLIIF